MRHYHLSFVFLLFMGTLFAQNDSLPYYQIPDAPTSYTQGGVISRMLDGLGFRFYWATQGLKEKDLKFRPSENARTTEETIHHIYQLSTVILNSALGNPNEQVQPKLDFTETRKKTLLNIQKASKIFSKENDLSKFTMVFKRGEKTTEFPFWNQINGPISDALWHVGQVVSFRRSSGNPFPKGVSV